MTTAFGFGNQTRCSAEDCRQFNPNATTLSLYEFAFKERNDSTVGENAYFWHVEDAATGQAILDCGSDYNNTGPDAAFYYCPLARAEPGYQCACLPLDDDENGRCRRIVLLLPGWGSAQLAVDGVLVAEHQLGESQQAHEDDDYSISNVYSSVVGSDCPETHNKCPSQGDALLEIYMRLYGESRSRLSLHLHELPSPFPPPNASSTVLTSTADDYASLTYTRHCVASTQCYNLTMSLPQNSDGSEYFFPIPTVVMLDGVYYVDQYVHFPPPNNENSRSYSAVIGNCTSLACIGDANSNRTGDEATAGTSTLLTVTMDTRGVRSDIKPGVGAWFVYDSDRVNETRQVASWLRFGRGYRSNETLRAHACVPSTNATNLTLAILKSLPGGVSMSVEYDGEALNCREEVPDAGSSSMMYIFVGKEELIEVYPWEIQATPLDGTCSISTGLSGGAIAGIVIGTVLGTLLLVSASWKLCNASRRQKR